MKTQMLQHDIIQVEDHIRKFEEHTGCELLLVVAKASDDYPGASLRFGLIGGFCVTFLFSFFYEFHQAYLWPLFMFITSMLLTLIGKQAWAMKIAISDKETDRETQEKAIELFHSLGTSQVSHHATAMIMVSLLERKVHVLVDEALKKEITQQELDDLIALMVPYFKQGQMASGLIKSIETLEEKILKDFHGKVGQVNVNELKNHIHFL